MYQALYRKWRPRTFDDVAGQEHVTETLKRQVALERLSHAYLFVGTRGTGKTSCAKILARAVNCESPADGNPCNECPSCRGIENNSILDVLELDAASNNRVDDVRALLDEVVYTPASVKKRVYIIDEVHMMTPQAFSALLQMLEEPPEHLVFILATTEVHKVPATIVSRCQHFSFKRIPADVAAARLTKIARAEGFILEDEAAGLLARLAEGSMRDALSLLDQCSTGGDIGRERVLSVLGLAGESRAVRIVSAALDGDAPLALKTLDEVYSAGGDMTAVVGELSRLTRDCLVTKLMPRGGEGLLSGGYDADMIDALSRKASGERLYACLDALARCAQDISRGLGGKLASELCVIKLCE
ncbi:MAG: DNA polymerase III subunit gamma/tau [Oscillospiraceae bacterium]|jgi:DNA polymerase-3 subunit gamma/tau|nr:DNA polymerase III subunit gamma/tau [Oscillospiraceae bacterium]